MSYEKQTWVDGQAGNTPITAERLNYMEQGIEDAGSAGIRTSINHGPVSGALTLDADLYSAHEMTLTGDIVLTLSGGEGLDMVVDIGGTGNVTLANGTWTTEPVQIPGLALFLKFATAGWQAFNVDVTTKITPAEVTFTDAGLNIAHIPVQIGGHYEKDGLLVTAGDHPGYAAGLATFVFVLDEGYSLASGAVDEWTHEFGALSADPLNFDAVEVGDLINWWKSTTGITITGAGVSQWNDQQAAADHLVQTTDANRPATVTIDGKTWIQFNATTDDLRKTSIGSPTDNRENTIAMVIRSEHANGAGVAGLPAGVAANIQFSAGGITDEPVHVRAGSSALEIQNIAGANNKLFIMYTIPLADPGVADLWVGNLASSTLFHTQMSVSLAVLTHLFLGGSAARFSIAELGIYSELKGQAEAEGLFAGAKVNWL